MSVSRIRYNKLKYHRPLSKIVKKGILTYNTRPFLPIPVNVNAVKIIADNLSTKFSYPFTVTDMGILIFKGSIVSGQALEFLKPLKIAFGKHDFCIQVANLADIEHITGNIEVDYSLSIF